MPFTTEQRNEIKKIFNEMPLNNLQKEEISLTCVTKDECKETTGTINKKINNDFADLAVIKFQNKLILAILSAVGVAVLGLVVKQFWGL